MLKLVNAEKMEAVAVATPKGNIRLIIHALEGVGWKTCRCGALHYTKVSKDPTFTELRVAVKDILIRSRSFGQVSSCTVNEH